MHEFNILVQAVNNLECQNKQIDKLIEKYNDVFNNKLGVFKLGKISLQLKPTAKPVFCKPRNVPYAYRKQLDMELERLQKEGIITPIDTSAWGTPLVIVPKNNGKNIRICGDYKSTINKHLEEVTYPLPRVSDIFSKLHKGEKFSKIDLSKAYVQCELEDSAKSLLVWSTHKGLFQVNRMMYGISPASAKFQKLIEQLFQGMENVSNFLDDILITGENDQKHCETLEEVLKKLKDAGLTVRREKCAFFQEQIEYLGHRITKDGLMKTEDKVRAISMAPRPKNVTEVRSFVGLVSYYSKFVENLADKLKPIYNLLKKNTVQNTNGQMDERKPSI